MAIGVNVDFTYGYAIKSTELLQVGISYLFLSLCSSIRIFVRVSLLLIYRFLPPFFTSIVTLSVSLGGWWSDILFLSVSYYLDYALLGYITMHLIWQGNVPACTQGQMRRILLILRLL